MSDKPCRRRHEHPAHKWIQARQGHTCPGVAPTPEWIEVPPTTALAHDREIRLTIVGPAGHGWDGTDTNPTEFVWDEDYAVTLEVRAGDEATDE